MNPTIITQNPTPQELLEITDFMCSTGVVLKPVQDAITNWASKNSMIACQIINLIDRYIHSWNRARWGEMRKWGQMTAHGWFAYQSEMRLIKFMKNVEAAKQKALADAA